ncbi:hypothetical protein [Oryza sativa Japonica Group]|uniref:Uncharacterized protein n=1 Tax=Oryza sativa subsp. japonica TaxID=39947 RepID=Q5JM06_ORYSJ|nr:hypothetical protein DAI22_01g330150 [Oryza sativa Japonica Group]BAD87302.1 hypothetical protein [Oryza sativa Japonica Group]BAD87501.1 hypothetical protein [Oryza sativa Japonica Group]
MRVRFMARGNQAGLSDTYPAERVGQSPWFGYGAAPSHAHRAERWANRGGTDARAPFASPGLRSSDRHADERGPAGCVLAAAIEPEVFCPSGPYPNRRHAGKAQASHVLHQAIFLW